MEKVTRAVMFRHTKVILCLLCFRLDSCCCQEALDEICRTLGDMSSATEIRALWNEYEEGLSEEAKIVKVCMLVMLRDSVLPTIDTHVMYIDIDATLQDFDKFEMILQADDYEKGASLPVDKLRSNSLASI